MVARFFPGARDELAAIDDEIVRGALGPVQPGKAQCFEDQYIWTGGQLYELMAGHDRFVADLRPLVEPVLRCPRPAASASAAIPTISPRSSSRARLASSWLDPAGGPLDAPLDIETDVAWVGYANAALRAQIEPHLQAALRAAS